MTTRIILKVFAGEVGEDVMVPLVLHILSRKLPILSHGQHGLIPFILIMNTANNDNINLKEDSDDDDDDNEEEEEYEYDSGDDDTDDDDDGGCDNGKGVVVKKEEMYGKKKYFSKNLTNEKVLYYH